MRCHPPPRITWLKDGVLLQGSSRHQQSELADGVCRLTISSPDATSDNGQYTCRAENNVWSEQISSTVQFAGTEGFNVLADVRVTCLSHQSWESFLSRRCINVATSLGSHSCADTKHYIACKSWVPILFEYQALHWRHRPRATLMQKKHYIVCTVTLVQTKHPMATLKLSQSH